MTILSRRGLSLLELTAALVLSAVVVAVALPRLTGAGGATRAAACDRLRGAIDLHAARHRRHTGAWPAADLSDLPAAAFPDGPPVCPVDGRAYTLDPATGETVSHAH